MSYVLLYLFVAGLMLFWMHCATSLRVTPEQERAEYDLQYEELNDPNIDNRTGKRTQ